MAYDDKIADIQQPQYAELYKLTVGNINTFYTSAEEDVVYLGDTYQARPIKRGDFTFSEKLRAVRVKITAPIDDNMQKYVGSTPAEPIHLIITRVFTDTLVDAIILFTGEVANITFQDNMAHADAEANTQVFRNLVPPFVFQSRCNHRLFDTRCAILESNFEVSSVVTVTGSTLVAAAFSGKPDGWFTGGHVRFEEDIRMITNHVTDTLTIQVPFDSRLQTGGTVRAFAGCDKSAQTCQTKFNNFENFVGFPLIPSSNPVIWGFK